MRAANQKDSSSLKLDSPAANGALALGEEMESSQPENGGVGEQQSRLPNSLVTDSEVPS